MRLECSATVERCKSECAHRLEELTGEMVNKDLRLEAIKDQMDQFRAHETQLTRELDR